MSTPPPPPPGEPSDPDQHPGSQPPPYWQQPSEGFASYPPPYAPPMPGGYGQQPEHPNATTALVLGIVGVICCALTAPFAWVLGKKAMDEIDASDGRIGGRSSAQAGYVLGILGTILMVLAIVLIAVVVAVGGFALTFNAGT